MTVIPVFWHRRLHPNGRNADADGRFEISSHGFHPRPGARDQSGQRNSTAVTGDREHRIRDNQ
jgi:hypothetical protein